MNGTGGPMPRGSRPCWLSQHSWADVLPSVSGLELPMTVRWRETGQGGGSGFLRSLCEFNWSQSGLPSGIKFSLFYWTSESTKYRKLLCGGKGSSAFIRAHELAKFISMLLSARTESVSLEHSCFHSAHLLCTFQCWLLYHCPRSDVRNRKPLKTFILPAAEECCGRKFCGCLYLSWLESGLFWLFSLLIRFLKSQGNPQS